jgi:hypothetical protein
MLNRSVTGEQTDNAVDGSLQAVLEMYRSGDEITMRTASFDLLILAM